MDPVTAVKIGATVVSVISSIFGGKSKKKAEKLRAAVAQRRGELDILFATIQEHNLWNYVGALTQVYEGRDELNLNKLLNDEAQILENIARENLRNEGNLGLLDQRGTLAENKFLDRQTELEMRQGTSEQQLGLDTYVGRELGDIARSQFGVDTTLVRTGAEKERIGLQEQGIGLYEAGLGLQAQGIGLYEQDIGLRERGLGLHEELLGRQEAEQGFISQSLQADERMRRTSLAAQASRGQAESELALLSEDLQRQEFQLTGQIGTARRRQAQATQEAEHLIEQASMVREQEAISTIASFGQEATRAGASGVAFSSTSLQDRRSFYQNQAVKATLSKVTGILHQADAKHVEAFVQGQEAGIHEFNLNSLRTSTAIRESNIRLQSSIEQQNYGSQAREIGYQRKLFDIKRANSIKLQGMTDAKYGMLEERFDANVWRQQLLSERFGALDARGALLDRRFGLVDIEEQANLIGAENKFRRSNLAATERLWQGQINYQNRGISMFSDSMEAQRAYETTYLNLAENRFHEELRHDDQLANQWYAYQAAIHGYNMNELETFRMVAGDEFNLNTRQLQIYKTLNQGFLARATGDALAIGADNAALQGYLGAGSAILELLTDILDEED